MKDKIERNYVSEVDLFLKKFDKDSAHLSESQKKEILKYEKVYFLRDNDSQIDVPQKLWKGF